ncbi:hypothetical protein B0H10DRAFT_1940549 [Mycena sp. CBHHK59/15]|nr:hypothetical protein B0H10DRAFT_1940549 [Mycena sp. CBHHK59/15]
MWLCRIALFAWQTQPNEWPIQYTQQHLVFLQPQYAPLYTTTDEAAAAKLWTVYVSEAEKYDKALLESWESDMDGMQAGLFSAMFDRFLDRELQVAHTRFWRCDSAPSGPDLTTMAAAANGTTFTPPAPTQFAASSVAVVQCTLVHQSQHQSQLCPHRNSP